MTLPTPSDVTNCDPKTGDTLRAPAGARNWHTRGVNTAAHELISGAEAWFGVDQGTPEEDGRAVRSASQRKGDSPWES